MEPGGDILSEPGPTGPERKTMLHKLSLVTLALCATACAASVQADADPRDGDAKIQEHIAQFFAAHDADASGTLSKAEAGANPFLAAHFTQADVDEDGQLTPEEATQLALDVHESHCEGGDCPDHASPEDHIQKTFDALDVDADGAVTAAEARGHHIEHMFAGIDADADGRVTRAELTAFAERMHGEPDAGHKPPHGHH
jgi:hypothetical protein